MQPNIPLRPTIALYLSDFPDHAILIGDMLLAFGDMESITLGPLSLALGGNMNSAAKLFYRLRGAEDRLNVADAILRPFMDRLGLQGPYGHWLGAMRKCKQIRNQYAHCAWRGEGGRLWFSPFDTDVFSANDEAGLSFEPVDLKLLAQQVLFFQYAYDLIGYLNAETKFRCDRRRKHHSKLPKSCAAPSLHSPR